MCWCSKCFKLATSKSALGEPKICAACKQVTDFAKFLSLRMILQCSDSIHFKHLKFTTQKWICSNILWDQTMQKNFFYIENSKFHICRFPSSIWHPVHQHLVRFYISVFILWCENELNNTCLPLSSPCKIRCVCLEAHPLYEVNVTKPTQVKLL